ncbi:MAG: carbamoyl-phosphate synthase large subunit [Treponema sp.]|nr:carbamoyl-phosphate synthase large subunit [Treponema sp.]
MTTLKDKPKKVLVLGSGGLKIGQAGEFDYSGSQALKALREEGIKTVLINPNIATIQTSEGMADSTYFLPVTPEFVKQVIEKEKPDGLFLSFGGQTALNCGVALEKDGVLYKYGVTVLGTPVKTIEDTEDRELFIDRLNEISALTPRSFATTDTDAAAEAAVKIGYPVMIRIAYALGGSGSGICKNEAELRRRCDRAFAHSPQVLVEEWLGGWKEIEYEVVRDKYDNCITVCNMENIDPLGIHTGESIVVAPCQTLNDRTGQKLRNIAIAVIRHLGIVGECNIQFALDPFSDDYRIIEVNARLSRSSALASKATGYPLAFVAAKIALGYSLTEISNSITKTTKSCFEPCLDYLVIKMPRWDLAKFKNVDVRIGSEMKSVGEVMSIGRSFEETLQKALRMTGTGAPGLTADDSMCGAGRNNMREALQKPTDRRIFIVYRALKEGWSVDRIYKLTKIDKWFLYRIANVLKTEMEIRGAAEASISGTSVPGTAGRSAGGPEGKSSGEAKTVRKQAPLPKPSDILDRSLLASAKRLGFSDAQIGSFIGYGESEIRSLREEYRIKPAVKQIDTMAGEFSAKINYLYMTYGAAESPSPAADDITPSGRGVMTLGSGVYRIGSSVEFDWCCVNAVETARKLGRFTIMVNCNPETVSTDYDMCDRLYFEELSLERVLDIYEKERPDGIILSMGGQIPNNLATKLYSAGAVIYGTSTQSIDNAEDRNKFSALLDKLGIEQPMWKELIDPESAKAFAKEAGYPVLVRPSYVLSGAAMNVAWNDDSLLKFLELAADVSLDHPVVISKYIENSKEIEIDAVAKHGEILFDAITEHIENAGVHSGDATVVLPAQRLYIETIRKIRHIAHEISAALDITGPFNIQFLAQRNKVQVIECNLRSSRSFPFCSKISRVNMIELAVKAMLDEPVEKVTTSALDLKWVGVKAAQFSFSRLHGADPVSGVEMASTGEVGCIGSEIGDALLKAMLSVGYRIPKKRILLSTGPIEEKLSFLDSARKLVEMGYELCASRGTAKFLTVNGIPAEAFNWPLESREPNIATLIKDRKVDMIINIPKNNRDTELKNNYIIRRLAVDFEIPLFTNIKVAREFIDAIVILKQKPLEIKAWNEYC